MTANIADKILKSANREARTTLAAPGKGPSDTSVTLVNPANWVTETAIVFSLYIEDPVTHVEQDGSYTEWKGIIAGSQVTNLVQVYGPTGLTYPAGSIAVMHISHVWANLLADAMLESHEQDGTLKDDAVATNSLSDSAVTTSKLADGAVTTPKIPDASIPSSKLDPASFPTNNAGTEYALPCEFFLGQQVYQKIINFGALPNNSSKTVSHGISDFTVMERISGIAWTAGNTILPLPFVNDTNVTTGQVSIVVSTSSISVNTASNRSNFINCYITLRYIK